MNDGPGLSAWDLANERMAAADVARSAELDRLCKSRRDPLERDAEARRNMEIAARAREARRKAKFYAEKADVPFWPPWALPLGILRADGCAACDREIGRKNSTNLCGRCQSRAGRDAVRMAVAVRVHRAAAKPVGGA